MKGSARAAGGSFPPERDDTQALGIVVEAPVILHQKVERFLAGVAERRVAQVMGKGDRLRQILVQAEGPGDGPANRGDLDRVGQAGTVMVSGPVEEDLGLAIKAAKGSAVDNAISVALVAGAEGVFLFGATAPRRLRGPLCVWGKKRFAGIGRHGKNEEL
jgi:hypothetical protein